MFCPFFHFAASISQAQWNCLREQEGFSFAIIEAWNGGYQLNQNRTMTASEMMTI